MYYATGYPINYPITFVNTSPKTYEITTLSSGNQVQYRGKIVPYPDINLSSPYDFDLSDIIQTFISTDRLIPLRSLSNTVLRLDNSKMYDTFGVTIEGVAQGNRVVAYNYSDTDISGLSLPYVLDNSPSIDIHPKQCLYFNILEDSLSGNGTVRVFKNGAQINSTSFTRKYNIFSYDLSTLAIQPCDKIHFTYTSALGTRQSMTYQCIHKTLNDCYTLYYVNRMGGIDFVTCSGNNNESVTVEPVIIDRVFNRSNNFDFGKKKIASDIRSTYVLNTGNLSGHRSKSISELFSSPKVWLHNHQTDVITSCIITDNSVKIKTFQSDKIFNYTINATDSQNYIIK